MQPRNAWRCATALLLLLAGCGSDKVNQLLEQGKQGVAQTVDQAKSAANSAVEQAKATATETVERSQATASQAAGAAQETLQLAGKAELNLGQPAKTAGCYAQFVPADGERLAVLVIQSYRDAASESFPSFFLRGTTSAASPQELAGQTINVAAFAQLQDKGPVLFSADASPLQLKITAVDDKQLSAELVGGSLSSSAGGAALQPTGAMTAVWLKAK
jgi:hypothetical protein